MTVKRFFPLSTEYLCNWQKKKNNRRKSVVPLSAVSLIRYNIIPGIGNEFMPFPSYLPAYRIFGTGGVIMPSPK